jgi:hypothetical protein
MAHSESIVGHDARNNVLAIIVAVIVLAVGAYLNTFTAEVVRAVAVTLFVVAVYGLILWFLWPYRSKKVATGLLVLAFVFAGLSASSLFGWWRMAAMTSSSVKQIATTNNSQQLKPPTLFSLFMSDLHPSRGISWEAYSDFDMQSNGHHGTIRIFYKIFDDFNANSKFMSFYVPLVYVRDTEPGTQTIAILEEIAKNPRGYLDIQDKRWVVMKNLGNSAEDSTRSTPFSGRIYFYHADSLNVEQLAFLTKKFREQQINAQFRGMDYAAAMWDAIRLGNAKAPPQYEVFNNKPRLVP